MSNLTLVIDTATTACSVALFESEHLIAGEYEEIGRGHAERLVPMISTLPEKGKANRIIVNCGPGSFTGVRIGLSAAKALALAWNAELSGYQCLHLVASQATREIGGNKSVCVAMIGGHGEYFVQNFTPDAGAVDALQSLPPEEALKNAGSMTLAGSAATTLANMAEDALALSILPDAANVMHLAESSRMLDASPIYGRSPDARLAQQG